jgi:hypothetical protein
MVNGKGIKAEAKNGTADSMIVLFGRQLVSVIIVTIKFAKKKCETSESIVGIGIRAIMEICEDTREIRE